MKSFFECADSARISKWVPAAPGAAEREGPGRQHFENGCVFRGGFRRGRPDGPGALEFPERTVIRGEFRDGSFLKGEIVYYGQVHMICEVNNVEASAEEFLADFTLQLESRWRVRGRVGAEGFLAHAEVFDAAGRPVDAFRGKRLKIKSGENRFLVITKTWLFEGSLLRAADNVSKNPKSLEFGDWGTQIWVRGFGYLKIETQSSVVVKKLLRVYKQVKIYRETVYKAGSLACSASTYHNGIIFLSEADSSRGELLLMVDETLFRLRCLMSDGINCQGSLLLPNKELVSFGFAHCVDSNIYFKTRQADLSLLEFKLFLKSIPPDPL